MENVKDESMSLRWKMEGVSPLISCSDQTGDRLIPVCPILVRCALTLLHVLVGPDIPVTQRVLSKPAGPSNHATAKATGPNCRSYRCK